MNDKTLDDAHPAVQLAVIALSATAVVATYYAGAAAIAVVIEVAKNLRKK